MHGVHIPTTWRDRVVLLQVVDEQQLTDTSNLRRYNSWTATIDHVTYRYAMVCSASTRVSRESDRKIDLSRTARCREMSMFTSVRSLTAQRRRSAGIGDG